MDSNVKPLISVLMPVYNCSKYIYNSTISILNQTFSDFELIIIDDCSTDNTVDILKKFNDERIVLIVKQKNTGITNSLNYALDIAKGKYLARMDGDDISNIDRLKKQYEFMESHPDVVLCGGGYEVIKSNYEHGQKGDIFVQKASAATLDVLTRAWIRIFWGKGDIRIKTFKPYLLHGELLFDLATHCSFAHPTVMIKSEVLKMNKVKYNPKCEPAEDYEMWTKLSEYGKLANIPDILIKYRRHEYQTTNTRSFEQKEISNKIALNHIKKLSKQNIYSEYYINHKLDALSDYKKYKSVEYDIQKYFEENKIFINPRILFKRERRYCIDSLKKDKFSVVLLFKKLPLLIYIFNVIGIIFILKYVFKSFVFWKRIERPN